MFGLLHKISRLTFETFKMANIENELEQLDVIHETLPTEIFVMILKKLGHKSLGNARLTCKEWKNVIDDFGLMKQAFGKFEI